MLHAFTDGRDTLPHSGAGYLAEVEGWGGARVATVTGRYYAMDRDKRWDRTKLAYDAIVEGQAEFSRADRRGRRSRTPTSAARPTSSSSRRSSATRAASATATASIFFNFRPDRARQLTQRARGAGRTSA